MTDDDNVTLSEFVAQKRHELDDFFAQWCEDMEADPDQFPGEMSFGDWDEQLEAFDT